AAMQATGPREAFALGKKAFNQAVIPNLEESLRYEGILQEEAGKTAEHREGVAAFLEKRTPRFE
ncbi:MAG: 2-(1,2-epoxy-1,2-dihydrophenyl)acetyl-CoA isomerase, partial [Chloroflexi bacterium]|nr:2-(1,2-epoxy-1,2-dihydrophenyl)acetyl-CoA isomerase [Chloroflexota bacterium]